MKLELDGRFEVAGVNPRREMHGDDRVIAVDVKMAGFVPFKQLPPILGVESADELEGTLWSGPGHDVTLLAIDQVKLHADRRFDGLLATLEDLRLQDTSLRKFAGHPVVGGIDMVFLLTLPHPDPGTIGQLSECIGETVKVKVDPHQTEMPLGEDAPGAEEEPSG